MSGQKNDKYSYGWSDPGGVYGRMAIQQNLPNYNICFHKDGKEIGKLDFNSGTLRFEGNADESAVRFIEYLSAQWSTRLHREQAEAMRLLAELVTFELADEVELDDAYRKGFNDAMQACRTMFLKKAEEKERAY